MGCRSLGVGKEMKIGITGTRNGMNERQRLSLFNYLNSLPLLFDLSLSDGVIEFHHGDCVGADVEGADIAKNLSMRIVCHPPINNDLRGFFSSDEYREPKTYFARNREIVKECNYLLVFPFDNSPKKYGGTWYTYDYAIKIKKRGKIFYPDKEVEDF